MYFHEGQNVTYIGQDAEGAQGRIIALSSSNSAHVMWDDGPLQGTSTLTDLYDVLPTAEAKQKDYAASDPMMLVAVRKAYNNGQEPEVLNFLASKNILQDEWSEIAKEAQAFVEKRIRSSASMDLPGEQLEPAEFEGVVRLSSRVLLRDAFSELDE